MVASWDATLRKDSAGAALYTAWRANVDERALDAQRPRTERLPLVEPGLAAAIEQLTKQQGADWNTWRYGPMHRRTFPHPFVAAYDLPTIERSGGAGTVAADGATYREILDVANWDRSVVTNVPGQSGQPESPFYGNLLPLYERGEYFPLVYSRARVSAEAAHRLTLRPK
jgi:penicillin amidase